MLLEETTRKARVVLDVENEADPLGAQRELVRQCGCYPVVATQVLDGVGSGRALAGSRITRPDLLRYAIAAMTRQRPLSRASRVVLQAIRGFWPDTAISSLSELARMLESAERADIP